MSAITRCPTCNTRFKASQEQLEAHRGMVRCGRCQAVFNAIENLHDDEPSPQLSLPIVTEEPAPRHTPPAAQEQPASSAARTTEESPPLTLAQQVTIAEEPPEVPRKPAAKHRRWPWTIGSLLLLTVLLAQAAYTFRVELAAHLPGLKPALAAYCSLLQCSIPLPQQADLMSIESSDMEADPSQSSAITLNATLRNRATYAQAFPDLELTLTDVQDKTLARRTFRPAEYLRSGEDEKQGLAPNRETGVKLHLDTTDLKPAGYRLFLFYPQP
ncbi:MAG: zinc-ribbon domain-containing protein [Nitrosomonadales bacterium]|nr:zinc-ribbon domain-containing protein [Nitrosomonadales bacterium]